MRSQISHMLVDSAWEQHVANSRLETSPLVEAYAKNDHLGFCVYYMRKSAPKPPLHSRLPDSSDQRQNVCCSRSKARDSDQHRAKLWRSMGAWVTGVNAKGGFGVWCHDVAFEMAKIHDILERHGTA